VKPRLSAPAKSSTIARFCGVRVGARGGIWTSPRYKPVLRKKGDHGFHRPFVAGGILERHRSPPQVTHALLLFLEHIPSVIADTREVSVVLLPHRTRNTEVEEVGSGSDIRFQQGEFQALEPVPELR
jgi:hypothetical protein